MSHKMNKLKSGHRSISFVISNGRDPVTGKQQIVNRTWRVPDTWSDSKAEKEAVRMEAEFMRQLADGTLISKHDDFESQRQEEKERQAQLTFDEYVEKFLEDSKGEREPSTINQYRHIFHLASNSIGQMKMVDIDGATLDTYIRKRRDEGVAFSTLKINFNALHLLFKTACDDGIIPDIPKMKRLKKPKRIAQENDEDKAFSEKETKYILQCADQENIRDKALIYLLLDSGIRRGEAAALRWDHVNFLTGIALIELNSQYVAYKGNYITTPKNGRSRKILLSQVCLSIMRQLYDDMKEQHHQAGTPMSGFCFENERGQNFSADAVSNVLRAFGKKYRIDDFHAHKLRHTMISISLSNGADPMIVSKKAGHSSLDMTYQVYSHAIEEGQRRASDALAAAIYDEKK